jgi:hypothetical protein
MGVPARSFEDYVADFGIDSADIIHLPQGKVSGDWSLLNSHLENVFGRGEMFNGSNKSLLRRFQLSITYLSYLENTPIHL